MKNLNESGVLPAELRNQLKYIAANSPFYQELFKKKGINVERIKDLRSFNELPVTQKEELQLYNNDFISVPKTDIIDYVTTSGTLGSPVSFALNDADLNRLAENERQSFEMIGVKRNNTVQLTTTLDRRFMAGLAYFLGLRKLGAAVIRTGSGLPALQWESIARFKPEVLVAVPSFLLKMINFAHKNDIDFKKSSVKTVVCIGEPLRNADFSLNALGEKIKNFWNLELFSTYASTEMGTAFTECKKHTGNHSLPNLIYTEVLNENLEPVAVGEIGELVVTPLHTQTMPLLRFATGDMVKFYGKNCDCGRKSLRISTPVGRKKQMIKLKGTTIYPQQIINVLTAFSKLDLFVIEARLDEMNNDAIVIKVPNDFQEDLEFQEHIQGRLKIKIQIKKVARAEIEQLKFPKESRKPKVFLDYR